MTTNAFLRALLTGLLALVALASPWFGSGAPAWSQPRSADAWQFAPDAKEPAKAVPREDLLQYLSEQWLVWPSRYVVVFSADRHRMHPAALRSMEEFIEQTMDRLGMTQAQRQDLQENRMRYFLCGSIEEVQLLGGEATEGITLPSRRAVVTRWLPHEHELVHLLSNLAVAPAPPATEPLLQEGLACALGGRRGMTPAVLFHEGEDVLASGRVDVSRLWGYADFHSITGDQNARYAAAGRFVQFLIETRGMVRFLRLYRLLSAEPGEIQVRPVSAALLQLEGIYETTWPQMEAEFAAWRSDHPTSRIETATAPPRPPDLWAADGGRVVSVWNESDGSMVVRIDGQHQLPGGVVLWGPQLPAGFRSRLLPGPSSNPSEGRRFGLEISPDRVDLYDFVLDRLTAHFVPESPDATDVDELAGRGLTVRISAEALEDVERPAALTLLATPTFEP